MLIPHCRKQSEGVAYVHAVHMTSFCYRLLFKNLDYY